MKKILAWALRICCFAVVCVAVFTLVRCLMHISDDHSRETVMGTETTTTTAAAVSAVNPTPTELPVDSSVEEDPTVVVSADGSATANHTTVTLTASFSNIVSSIVANLTWTVDGTVVGQSSDCLLVEGSTVTINAPVDVETEGKTEAAVELTVDYDDKSLTADTTIPVEQPDDENGAVIQTEEITVTAKQDSGIYNDSNLTDKAGGEMAASDTGLLLAYDTNNSGLSALKLKFEDGSEGWVSADKMDITKDDCTTDEDYTDEQKTDFVNSMGYDSATEYLVWVSLYTQKVNVFTGYKGNWVLTESFDCASGTNETPTTTGIYTYDTKKDRWDLGKTYVAPVLVFNGGEAFTSQPRSVDTDEIADNTMGKPASGGSVRMGESDINWMSENLPLQTMVVIY